MDVALAGLADKAAVVFASGVNFAIAKAAHSRHVPEPQTFFFNGQEAVVVGSSHVHPSVGQSRVASCKSSFLRRHTWTILTWRNRAHDGALPDEFHSLKSSVIIWMLKGILCKRCALKQNAHFVLKSD